MTTFGCIFIFQLLFIYDIFVCGSAGSLLLCDLSSGCSERARLSSCGAWVCHCGGFPCGAQAPGLGGSAGATCGLSSCGTQA